MLVRPHLKNLRKTPQLHVLLVEDDHPTAEAMQKLLEAHHFSVRAVGSYRQALTMASQWMPDVLVSDIGLPGKDGIELMKTMRRAYPNLCGIVVSGHVRAEDIRRSREAGFSEHLAKPINIEQLVSAIHRRFATTSDANDSN